MYQRRCFLPFIVSVLTRARLEKVKKKKKKSCFSGDVKTVTVRLWSIFWCRGANATFFAFSFMLRECTNFFWNRHVCKKQRCPPQWGFAPFLFLSGVLVWNNMSYDMSLLDLLVTLAVSNQMTVKWKKSSRFNINELLHCSMRKRWQLSPGSKHHCVFRSPLQLAHKG